MRSKPKVFISYAKEDVVIAKRLYGDLKKKGVSPWLDLEDILPGQDIDTHIKKAIRESDFFIVILSTNSLSNRGYVQKELKYAMDILVEYPKSEIFLIPVRIEDCAFSNEEVLKISIVDIFSDYNTGLEKIIKAIQSKQIDKNITYEGPLEITSKNTSSAMQISSKYLKSPAASIGMWVYVSDYNEGIRRLVNNRYLIAHDTNKGLRKKTSIGEKYVNTFALLRGPLVWKPIGKPCWKLWLSNNEGEQWTKIVHDTIDFSVGWHHFLVRWDHNQPIIELIIDGHTYISENDYIKYWPNKFNPTAYIGSWQNFRNEHFIETKLWRIATVEHFIDEQWIDAELKYKGKCP